jgi:hypothetical protein
MTPMVTRLRLPTPVQDVLLAVFVAAFQLRGTRLVGAGQELARPLADPAWLGYLLLAAGGLVLAVRRRWPVAVFAVTAAASSPTTPPATRTGRGGWGCSWPPTPWPPRATGTGRSG